MMAGQRTASWSHTTWIQVLLVLALLLLVARVGRGTHGYAPYYLTVFRAEPRLVAPGQEDRCGTVELDLEVVSSREEGGGFSYEVLRLEGEAWRTVAAGALHRNDDEEIVGTATWRIQVAEAGEAWTGEVRVGAYSKGEGGEGDGTAVRLETIHELAIAIPQDACWGYGDDQAEVGDDDG